MAFQQSKSSLLQTAYNVAGQVTSALVSAGAVSADEVLATIEDIRNTVFEDLVATFQSEPAPQAQAPRGGGQRRQNPQDPASLVLDPKYKKHAGQTLAQVYEEDPTYVEWLANKANNKFINDRASAFLAQAKQNQPEAPEEFPF